MSGIPTPTNQRNMEEIWKDVPGYEGYYQISNRGSIKSIKRIIHRVDGECNFINERILKQKKVGSGYLAVILSKNANKRTEYLHRLVAISFLNRAEHQTDVNHIDGTKTNNHVNNLEWCSKSENSIHAFKNKLNIPPKPMIGADHKSSKAVIQLDFTGNTICEYVSTIEASKKTGVYASGVSRACCGKLKSAGGYLWKYKTTE